jgi:hypothetical protein
VFRDSPPGPDPRRSEASVVGEEYPTVDVNSALPDATRVKVSKFLQEFRGVTAGQTNRKGYYWGRDAVASYHQIATGSASRHVAVGL